MFTLPLPAAADIGQGGGGGGHGQGDEEGVRGVTLPGQIVLGESGAFIMGRDKLKRPRPEITHGARLNGARDADYETGWDTLRHTVIGKLLMSSNVGVSASAKTE